MVSNQLVTYVSFQHILTSVEVVHSWSVKKMYRKMLQALSKNVFDGVPF